MDWKHTTNPPKTPWNMDDKQSLDGNASEAFRDTEIVTLLVGHAKLLVNDDPPVKFRVHQRLLGQCSPFFRTILSRPKTIPNAVAINSVNDTVEERQIANWKEGRTKIIELPDDRPEDFEMLLSWLYSGGVRTNVLDAHSRLKSTVDAYTSMVKNQPGLAHAKIDAVVRDLLDVEWSQAQPSSKKRQVLIPDLEPLIGLYILADKYNIESNQDFTSIAEAPCAGLRRQITLRIKVIWDLVHFPTLDLGDLTRLWSCVPVDTEGSMGLKHAFVEELARQNASTLRAYSSTRSWMNDRSMCRQMEDLFEPQSGKPDDRMWPAEFLKDLLVQRTFW